MHLTRNQAYLHGYRGFKSLSLRQVTRIAAGAKKATVARELGISRPTFYAYLTELGRP